MHVNSLLQHGGARVISVTREANQLGLCPRPWRGRVGEKEGAGKRGRRKEAVQDPEGPSRGVCSHHLAKTHRGP